MTYKKSHRLAFVLLMSTCFLFSTLAFAGEDELTPEQKKLKADIEGSLIAPCCWNMTVDHHDSPKSTEVKQKVLALVKAGKTKDEILDYFVAQPQYGERILATPSQKNLLGKFAYWLIPIAIFFGIVAVVISLRHLTKSRPEAPVTKKTPQTKAAKTSTPDAGASAWDARVEEELKAFD